MLKLRRFVLAVVVLGAMAAPVFAGLAPVNPEFLEWKNARSEKFNASESSAPPRYPTGYIPSPVDLSHLRNNPPILAAADELPVSYDLRALGRLTPIRFQNPWGTCWAFAAIAAAESNYLTHLVNNDRKVDGSLGNAETLDLSELHMSWYVKNNPNKTKVHTVDLVSRVEPAINNIEAGLPSMSLAYYARLDGPVLEKDLPYLSYTAISNDAGYSPDDWDILNGYKSLPSYSAFQQLTIARTGGRTILPLENMPANAYGVKLRLTDALYGTYSPIVGREGYYTSGDKKYIVGEFVKRLVMEHGALEIAYHDADGYYDKEHHSFFYDGSDSGDINHAVTIVGWDDNFPRTSYSADRALPESDGAWLVRNNWGEFAESDHGYFWMSYEQPVLDALAFIVEDLPEGLRVYEYDPLGWCNGFGNGESKTMWAANTFKVKSNGESLESISFYTTDNNATCEWSIYYGMTDKPSNAPYNDDALKISGSSTYPYAGYHTVKLDSTIALTKGEYFAVVVKFTNTNHEYPVGVEAKVDSYSDFAVIHDGESWFSDDGSEWEDGSTIEGVARGYENVLQSVPMNACIKAFTIDTVNDNEIEADEDTILGIKVDDVDLAEAVDVSSLNPGIPDEPISERLLILPSNKELSEGFYSGTSLPFLLINRTEEREFVSNYSAETDTRFPKGLSRTKEVEYDPLFDFGYEPDGFCRLPNGLEFPVYGPFIDVIDEESCLSLDVNELKDMNGSHCAIPKGYYDFVYMRPNFNDDDEEDNFVGKISLRLSATTLDDTDTQTSSTGSSSSNCNAGSSTVSIILLVGLAFMLTHRTGRSS